MSTAEYGMRAVERASGGNVDQKELKSCCCGRMKAAFGEIDNAEDKYLKNCVLYCPDGQRSGVVTAVIPDAGEEKTAGKK